MGALDDVIDNAGKEAEKANAERKAKVEQEDTKQTPETSDDNAQGQNGSQGE